MIEFWKGIEILAFPYVNGVRALIKKRCSYCCVCWVKIFLCAFSSKSGKLANQLSLYAINTLYKSSSLQPANCHARNLWMTFECYFNQQSLPLFFTISCLGYFYFCNPWEFQLKRPLRQLYLKFCKLTKKGVESPFLLKEARKSLLFFCWNGNHFWVLLLFYGLQELLLDSTAVRTLFNDGIKMDVLVK